MPITILINQHNGLRRVAYLKEGHLVDIDVEWPLPLLPQQSFLDQIYWGRVVRSETTHVFVKLSETEVGLLPLEQLFSKPTVGQAILVQIRREAIPDQGTQDKGPLLTRKITLAGRYCLFHPHEKKAKISSKITDPLLRNHLQALLSPQDPFTLRAAAAQASAEQIQEEMAQLCQKYAEIESLSAKAPLATPYDALPPSHRWIRDLDANEGPLILVDDNEALVNLRPFINSCRPDLESCVKKHNGPLFEEFGLEDFWDSLFEDVVALPSGGNVVITVTPAAIVIDVNQGDKAPHETNIEAASVIVQHLKGRHLGGNIIIDFMGVQTPEKARSHIKNLLLCQAAIYGLPLDIFGWSKLGWMEARLPKRRVALKERRELFKGK
jgi:Rne/Rng family ribonuclease